MKILFDQGTPAPLRHSLVGHTVATAFEQGWSNLQNGDLIRVAEADGFNALITTDQNLKSQQTYADGSSPCLFFRQRAGRKSKNTWTKFPPP